MTNVIQPENALKSKEKLLGTEPEVYVRKAPLESPVFKAESAKHNESYAVMEAQHGKIYEVIKIKNLLCMIQDDQLDHVVVTIEQE